MINNKAKVLMKEGEKIRDEINTILIHGDFPQDRSKNVWKNINALINNEILTERETN